MARESYFITKTDVGGMELIEVAGTPAVEHHELLRSAVSRRAGADVADLFAEPIYRRGNGAAPAVISWYGHLPDQPHSLSAMDAEEREPVVAALRRKLRDAAGALSDPQFGPLIGAALHVRDPSDIWVMGDRPLIVNWGMVPQSVGQSPAARREHFAATLGPYLPLDTAPPITAEEQRAMIGAEFGAQLAAGTATAAAAAAAPTVAAAAAQGTNAGAEPVTDAPRGAAPSPPPPPPPIETAGSGGYGWRWIPLISLLLLVVAAIVLVSIPGVLLYPPERALSETEIVEIARESNDALRERRDRLRAALDEAVCRADGEIEFPNVPLPDLGDDGTEGETERAATPDDLLPSAPDQVVVPPSDEAGEPSNLLTHIEDRTAMVLVSFPNSIGTGSGFFITPELFVTNDHVIYGPRDEQAKLGAPQRIWVKSEKLGKGLPAELVSASGQTARFGRDFALLRVPGANAPFFQVWSSTGSIKLQEVIAAGFPGAYFQIDQNRSAMYNPDSPEMPDMVMTQGTVNAQQKVGERRTLAVVHSADISSGNSGGPLIDACGRVVGVNTFGIKDQNTDRFLNFSLHTAELLDFLGAQRNDAQATSDACRPQVQEPPRVARQDPDASQEPNGDQAPAPGANPAPAPEPGAVPERDGGAAPAPVE